MTAADKVYEAFWNQQPLEIKGCNVSTDGTTLFSYDSGYWIAKWENDMIVFRPKPLYSITTSKQQGEAMQYVQRKNRKMSEVRKTVCEGVRP